MDEEEVKHHCPCCGIPAQLKDEGVRSKVRCPYCDRLFLKGECPPDFNHVCDCNTKRWDKSDFGRMD